jgi:7-cyano-7-deazaguanine synthase in queuosine biosynthesis
MVRDAKAILFSGGLDSTCAAILNPNHQLVRVATGSKYDAVEAVHAALIAQAWGGRSLVAVDGVLDLGRYEQDDALVPARNALVALVAAQHAVELTLVSVAGDGTHATDKDVRFADIMSELLAKLFGEGAVTLPYRKWSKLQLLKRAIEFDQDATLAALPHVWSCYDPVHVETPGVPWSGRLTHCGQCKACVRLHGALAWADVLAHGPTFAVNPFDMPMQLVRDIYAGRGEEERLVLEVHHVCNRNPR